GSLIVAGAGASQISGGGTLLNLKFEVIGSNAAQSDLTWQTFRFNGGTPCSTPSNGHLSVVNGSVSGTVTYGITPQGQSARNVSGVQLSAVGSSTLQTTTDSTGAYQLSNFGAGAYTVTPSKTGGAGQPFSTVDATRILQSIVGLTNLSAAQQAAADSDSSGDLSSLDASNVLRAIVGLPNTGAVGQWRFLPASREYPSVTTSQTNQNYQAVVVGDVDGDWNAASSRIQENEAEANVQSNPASSLFSAWMPQADTLNRFDTDSPQAVTVSLPANTSAATGTNSFVIPITVGDTTGENITGFNFVLDFNSSVVQPAGTGTQIGISRAGTLSADFLCVANANVAGQLSVACSGAEPIEEAGTLLNLRFNVVGTPGAQTNLTFSQFRFNAGTPQATVTNGAFRVSGGPTAAMVSISGTVITPQQIGADRMQVTLTDMQGNRRTAQTTRLGTFRFTNVTAGETYILTVSSKRYTYAPQVITVTEDLTELVFTAQ
ncbi:MAG TPA: hypothetical protein VK308_04185, partial [Pyrinomonadaceae bacterium]|nr:hypothetical protein [Pyrinomonadaceae bacterium]